jgi:hypothetical protein
MYRECTSCRLDTLRTGNTFGGTKNFAPPRAQAALSDTSLREGAIMQSCVAGTGTRRRTGAGSLEFEFGGGMSASG